jgi:hypothetical protein
MTTRHALARIAVVLVVLTAVVLSRLGRQTPLLPFPQQAPYVHVMPQPRFEWLHNRWLVICPPSHSVICAG